MSSVSLSLHQVTSVTDGPAYKVLNEITAAQGISPAVFVYKAATQKFSHVATLRDMSLWPDSYDFALQFNKPFYRLTLSLRTWKSPDGMQEDVAETARRVARLLADYNNYQASVATDVTTTFTGE
jgi:hypothetical protein